MPSLRGTEKINQPVVHKEIEIDWRDNSGKQDKSEALVNLEQAVKIQSKDLPLQGATK